MNCITKAARLVGGVACASLVSSCVFEFAETETREHGTVGAEVFRVVCMNLAAQAFPNDLTGERFTTRCEGKESSEFDEVMPERAFEQQALARFNALVGRREVLVPALEAVFGSDTFGDDELRHFLSSLIPLYDAPELFPEVTREVAKLLQGLISHEDEVSKAAIAAFERMGTRDGYRPLRLALGIARPTLEYPGLDDLVATTLESLDPQHGDAREAWHELLRAAAFDLATADTSPPTAQAPGTLALAKRLLFADDAAFSSRRGPLYLAARDFRGIVRPKKRGDVLPAPFQDADGDGMADIDALGRLVVDDERLPTPFRTLSAVISNSDDDARDSLGRALNPMADMQDPCTGNSPAAGCGAPCDGASSCGEGLLCGNEGTCVWDGAPPQLYEYLDVDRTLLAAVTRDVGPLLLPKDATLTASAIHDFAYGLHAVLGDFKQREYDFGHSALSFVGPDTSTGPLFDFVYALGTLMPFDATDQLLQVLEALLRDHEKEVAGLIEAILYIDQRADAYPDARWQKPHEFWDDLIAWTQRVVKREKPMLEALLRATATEESARSGILFGNFMRFKDRVVYPQGKREELERLGTDMKQVPGLLDEAATAADAAMAVQEHRENVNYPCQNPPTRLVGGDVSDRECLPTAPHPAPDHKGIRGCAADAPYCGRGCPAEPPEHGASCATAGGYGLCSWAEGSCTCDCGGGLCRGDMTPTWTCNDARSEPLPRTPGYAVWVDRTQPDHRVGTDAQTNQSLFQRTLALVHDLHAPARLCNRHGAQMSVYGIPLIGSVSLPTKYEACELLDERQIVQFFAQSIVGTATLKLEDETWDRLLDRLGKLGLPGVNKNDLMERQSQIRGLYVDRPTPQAVARLVFSPFNHFERDLLDLPLTRDKRAIVDLHRDTIFAWEIEDPVAKASYYQALTPLLEAFDRNEQRDEDGNLVDGYLFGDLISIVHKHWSSRASDATIRECDDSTSPPTCTESAPLFAYQSNGVSYEELVAEALVDAQLMARLRDVMLALESIEVDPGVDGIKVLANVMANLVDPARSCAKGDCVKHPLTFRDGRSTTTTNTGKGIAQVTPAHLLLDALNDIDKRFEGENEKRLGPWREARSQLVDLLAEVDRDAPGEWRLQNPRSRPVLINLVRFVRERLAFYRDQQRKCLADGGDASQCDQLREWSVGLTGRLERSLGQPISAATLRLLERFWGLKSDPGGQLLKMVYWLSQEKQAGSPAPVDATLLAAADMLQLFEDTENTAPVMRFMSRTIAPNAVEVATSGEGELALNEGAVEKALALMREIKTLDPGGEGQPSTLTKLLASMVKVHGKHGETPIEVIIDVIAEVNRARPGLDSGKSLDTADLRSVLGAAQQFLSNERHGLERLFDIIQARELP